MAHFEAKDYPGSCQQCGAIVCMRVSKNGVWGKFDLDMDLDPTRKPHRCHVAEVKRKQRELFLSKSNSPNN